MKYKVGDVVKIKKNLKRNVKIDGWYSDGNTQNCLGKMVKIIRISKHEPNNRDFYIFTMRNDDYNREYLTDGMIEKYICDGKKTLNWKEV